MCPRVDQPPDPVDVDYAQAFREWLGDDLLALLREGRASQRSIYSILGRRIDLEWRPESGRLVASTGAQPEPWLGQHLEGRKLWGGPLLDPKYIPLPRRSAVYGRVLEEAGWIRHGDGFTATWSVHTSSAWSDAQEVARLVLLTLTEVYHCDLDPLMLEVYDSSVAAPQE